MAKEKLRIGLSKKLRFEVFKRDCFKCQYCGSTPPGIILEVDHIVPVSKDGTNEIDNLITSCFDCNRGKSNRDLSSLPESTADKMEQMHEKEAQYLAFKKAQQKIQSRIKKELNGIEAVYSHYFEGFEFTDRFKNGSVRTFVKLLGFVKVEQAMHTACGRMFDENKALKYFCGICWNKIREEDNG